MQESSVLFSALELLNAHMGRNFSEVDGWYP